MTRKINRVAVFGGSWPKPGHPAYQQALELGRLLGTSGFTVLTGGYVGVMEAVSRGAAERNAHVVGVTCDEIERFRPVGPNAWVKEEQRFSSLRSRLMGIIEGCDAALALPGGVGTLTEVSLMWNHMLVSAISPRPLILVGLGWETIIASFFQAMNDYIPAEQRAWITLATDIHAAVEILQNLYGNDKVKP